MKCLPTLASHGWHIGKKIEAQQGFHSRRRGWRKCFDSKSVCGPNHSSWIAIVDHRLTCPIHQKKGRYWKLCIDKVFHTKFVLWTLLALLIQPSLCSSRLCFVIAKCLTCLLILLVCDKGACWVPGWTVLLLSCQCPKGNFKSRTWEHLCDIGGKNLMDSFARSETARLALNTSTTGR